ncbi:MOSC domain-containing protein [Mycobacterium sp. TNTM28]|uniref:MOSC domain-containing protein n=1 Tax=[Mycobacterium] fortunisiensis TaxID=2600579 RepID=A0ABS6KNK3_9MYCO|nr:MOSC domain-containing protein [[Mycobacterium] fortunisiensis]MBU9765172.1 MOSC domain-containing protein [[Mycobacterium] fortunisiensis]
MAQVLTVNVAHPRPNTAEGRAVTGIDKRPVTGAVAVRAPGPMHGGLGSGLVGDIIGDQQFHGGDDQAVYAYAREDLDAWQVRLDREIANGEFGENLTTAGIDVTNALIGERWRVGKAGLELEVSRPRIPCRTFANWLQLNGWVKTFTRTAIPGAYFRLVTPGSVAGGDDVTVTHRPDHDVTIGVVFRALTLEPGLLPQILRADALAEPIRELAERRINAG